MSDFQPVGFTYGLCDPSSEEEKQNTVLNSSAPPPGGKCESGGRDLVECALL